jgi:hypothetical protein
VNTPTITLPPGFAASDVITRREKLAANLPREEHETCPTQCSGSAAEWELWVANKGALDKPTSPSPMLGEDYGTSEGAA